MVTGTSSTSTELAAGLRSFQTVNAYQASRQVYRHFGDNQIYPVNPDDFLFRERCSRINRLNVYEIEFVGGVEVRNNTTRDDFLFHLPLAGRVEVHSGKGWQAVEPKGGFMIAPQVTPNLRFPQGGRVLVLKVDHQHLRKQASQLLRYTPNQALEFPLLGFDGGVLSQMRETIGFFMRQLAEASVQSIHPLRLRQVEQLLLTDMLLLLENSYRPLLDSDAGQVMPRVIRLARDYMRSHITDCISLADLCRVAEVSERSLIYSFKQFCGLTPMHYLRELRLDGLRDELVHSRVDGTVTEIALKWGFNHAGRLARYYQERFGELPSTTLVR